MQKDLPQIDELIENESITDSVNIAKKLNAYFGSVAVFCFTCTLFMFLRTTR